MSDTARPPSLVRVETHAGGVTILSLDNPPANCYTHAMMLDLDRAILAARFDPAVRVVIVEGAGPKFFCAGADIGMLAGATPEAKYAFCLHANETLNRLEHSSFLTIAALDGHAVGGGLEIALACDLRLARRGSGKIGLPEVGLGVLPGTGGTQRLARTIGKARALALMIEGRNLDYEEAERLGLVTHLWEGDSEAFRARVLDYARGLCPPAKASLAVAKIKRAVQSGLEMSFEQALALERELQAQLFASDDAREGLAAYVEKRTPKFEGR